MATNNDKYKKAEAGALWISDKNPNVISGSLKKVNADGTTTEKRITIFKNKYKEEGSKSPDYRIYWSDILDKEAPSANKPAAKPAAKPAPAPKPKPAAPPEDDDIPL